MANSRSLVGREVTSFGMTTEGKNSRQDDGERKAADSGSLVG